MKTRVRPALLLALAASAHTTTALASHPPRMPEVREVIVKADEPNTVVLATRYGGHYFTRDGGATWTNVCHEALGADDTETYGALFSRGGALVAATGFRGIASSGDACSWTQWAPPDRSFITDVTSFGDGRIVALDRQSPPRFWSSEDGGGAFAPFGTAIPEDVDVTSVEASDDGQFLYVAGQGSDRARLFRTGDAAESWQILELPDTEGLIAELVGVAPGVPDLVVMKLSGPSQGKILLTRNGGESWESVYEATHAVPAAALSSDGTLFFGGPDDGLHRGSVVDVGAGYQRIADVHPLSLTASGDRLFAVTSRTEDGHSVALSTDGGYTFQAFFDVCRATLAESCGADTTVGRTCSTGIETMPWQPLGNACETRTGDPDAPLPPAPDTPDPLMPGEAGGAPGDPDGSGNPGGEGTVDAPASASCALGAGRPRGSHVSGLVLASSAVWLLRRRRCARHRCV